MRHAPMIPTRAPTASAVRAATPRARAAARLLALILVTAFTAGQAAAGGLKVTGPAIELDPPRFDFGDLPQEHIERVTCTVRNGGTETLKIHEVTSDCGCTVAQIPDSTLAPGESVDLSITFSTRHFSGEVIKNVFLRSNDPGAPKARIRLNAFVRAILGIDPDALDFGRVPRGETPSETVLLRSATADSVEIRSVTVPEEIFAWDLQREQRPDSTFHRLTLTIRSDAPVGAFTAAGRVETNIEALGALTISLRGQVHGFFLADPARLPLGQVRQGETRTRSLELIAQGEGRHKVLGVRSSDDRLQAEVIPIEEGRRYRVDVTLPADARPGRINATLMIETDDPAQREISVRVPANVLPKL